MSEMASWGRDELEQALGTPEGASAFAEMERLAKENPDLLGEALRRLEDEETLEMPGLEKSIGQAEAGNLADITPEE